MAKELIAYCMKTKKKEPMHNAKITKNSKGRFAAEGETKEGHKMFLFLSEANALAAVKDGVAKKAW
jgi:hypothetical protein